MWHSPATFLILVLFSLPLSPSGLQGLTFDPDDYLEVYPDPRDEEVLQGRTPLYFSLFQSLGGPFSQFDASGSVAGVKIALDRINNDSSLLPGYTLHYTFANSKVCGYNSLPTSSYVALDLTHASKLSSLSLYLISTHIEPLRDRYCSSKYQFYVLATCKLHLCNLEV